MPIELEKKYRLGPGDRESIVLRLEALGARFDGETFEENTIFPLMALTGKQAILRIRRTEAATILTLKQRVPFNSDIKHQIEHETEVSDHNAMREIIGQLGLKPLMIYEKKRTTWRYEDAEIVLDELPFGSFMEIEGSEDAILQAEKDLDIPHLIAEPRTYPMLTAEYGELVDGVKESRFLSTSPLDR